MANTYTVQTQHLATKQTDNNQDSQGSESPEGDIDLSGALKTQDGDTQTNKFQIKPKNREAKLQFLFHQGQQLSRKTYQMKI